MSAAPSVGIASPVAKAILGRGVVFKGQILSRENLAIEGEVEGTIDMIEHRLTIGTDGNVRANVKALDIDYLVQCRGISRPWTRFTSGRARSSLAIFVALVL